MLVIEQAHPTQIAIYKGQFWDFVNNNSNCVMAGMQGCVPNKTTTSVLALIPQRHS
jgi:hypothetical protein